MQSRNLALLTAGIILLSAVLTVWRIDAQDPRPAEPAAFLGRGGAVRGPTGILYLLPDLASSPATTLGLDEVLAMQGRPLLAAMAALGQPSRRDPGPSGQQSCLWFSAVGVQPTAADATRVAHVLIEPEADGRRVRTVMVVGSLGMLRISRPDWRGLERFRAADPALEGAGVTAPRR